MKEDLLKIFNHYGEKNQRRKLNEEHLELQDELYYIYKFRDESENLLSEIVDVIVLVLQFAYEYGLSDEEIGEMIKFKIKRQLKRMEEENANN